jgi:phosphoenolpyruvate carboxylase
MERNWPFFNSMLDMLDMVISKADPEISKIYEEYLADESLKRVGRKLRFQFDVIKKLNKKITPKEIIVSRKQFRTSVIIRNIYSEVLNIIQPIVIKKLKNSKNKQDKAYLNDALLTSIAGISAAMKNTG